MWGRVTGWRQRHHRSIRILLIALPLAIALSASYLSVRELALRSADHLTITVTRLGDDTSGPAGSVVFHRTFGQALAKRAEQLLNDDTIPHGPFDRPGGMLPYSGAEWHYHLAFTWHGVLVETADLSRTVLPEQFTISSLGLPDISERWAEDRQLNGYSLIGTLSDAAGGIIPLPPTPNVN